MLLLKILVAEGQLHLIAEDLAKICEERRHQTKDRLNNYWGYQETLFEIAAKHLEQNLIDHEKASS